MKDSRNVLPIIYLLENFYIFLLFFVNYVLPAPGMDFFRSITVTCGRSNDCQQKIDKGPTQKKISAQG